jgi:hypothetical protein
MCFFPQTSSNVLFPSHVAVVRACGFFDCRVGQTVVPATVAPPPIAAKAYLLIDVLSGQTSSR